MRIQNTIIYRMCKLYRLCLLTVLFVLPLTSLAQNKNDLSEEQGAEKRRKNSPGFRPSRHNSQGKR